MQHHFFKTGVILLAVVALLAGSTQAAITPEQRKELKEIGMEITKAGTLISRKKYDDAATAISTVEERFNNFVKESGLKETDPILKPVRTQLEKAKNSLAKVAVKGAASFEKSVAPILAAKCSGCHEDDPPKGGLRLDTFEGLEKGGQSGALLVAGSVDESLLFQRLITQNEQLRMPKGKDALTEKEVLAIGTWISDGAKFDGDKTATMSALVKGAADKPGAAPKKPGKVEVKKEAGNETVHFMKDLMPEMMDTCGRCHNDTTKRSGFSVVSFEKLMKGGSSGAVIVPGEPEKSRLWRLVNGDDTPLMPAGNQTGITRKWHGNLRTWILEGAKFDGADPKKNFPSLEEREAAAMASMSPEQWIERRKKSTDAQWKKTFPNGEPNQRESSDFLIVGDVTNERLEQVDKWANEHLAHLRQTFKVKEEPLWKGKLAIFVFKERFGYEEFNNSVHRREVPREVMGHSQVSATMDEALIALQDVGDSATDSSPGMQVNLIEHMTGAFFKRGGGKLPDWLVRGSGLALAHQKSPGNPYLAAMPRVASGILQETKLADPALIFGDGTFSPGEVGPIGLTLVEFLLKRASAPQFGQFVQRLQAGATPDAATRDVYQTDSKALAMQYASSLPSSGGGKKGKK